MAKDRGYFYPQIVLTCKDKILAQIEDEEYNQSEEESKDLKESNYDVNYVPAERDLTMSAK